MGGKIGLNWFKIIFFFLLNQVQGIEERDWAPEGIGVFIIEMGKLYSFFLLLQ